MFKRQLDCFASKDCTRRLENFIHNVPYIKMLICAKPEHVKKADCFAWKDRTKCLENFTLAVPYFEMLICAKPDNVKKAVR